MVIRDYGDEGKCDARCYGAKGNSCHCECEGKNHGIGLMKAIENEFGSDTVHRIREQRKELAGLSESNLKKAIKEMLV